MRILNLLKCLPLCCICCFLPLHSFGQTSTNPPAVEGAIGKSVQSFDVQDFDSIQTPNSPAFSLLGVTPTTIDKPTTPSAVGASLLSTTGSGQSGVPKNVAIQFSPYWLTSHPDLKFEDYYNANIPQTILQTMSVSFGTAESDITNSAGTLKGTAIGVGLGFNIFSGNKSPELDSDVKKLKTDQLKFLGSDMTDDSQIRADGDKIRNLDKQRVGFGLSFASAFSLRVPDQSGQSIQADRFGTWLTPSYKFNGNSSIINQFTVLGVARYIRDFRNVDNYFDEGGRIMWTAKQIPLSLSGEYLYREATTTGSSSKYGILAQYAVNKNFSVFANFGKAFKSDIATGNDNIAMFGVTFGYTKAPMTP